MIRKFSSYNCVHGCLFSEGSPIIIFSTRSLITGSKFSQAFNLCLQAILSHRKLLLYAWKVILTWDTRRQNIEFFLQWNDVVWNETTSKWQPFCLNEFEALIWSLQFHMRVLRNRISREGQSTKHKGSIKGEKWKTKYCVLNVQGVFNAFVFAQIWS